MLLLAVTWIKAHIIESLEIDFPSVILSTHNLTYYSKTESRDFYYFNLCLKYRQIQCAYFLFSLLSGSNYCTRKYHKLVPPPDNQIEFFRFLKISSEEMRFEQSLLSSIIIVTVISEVDRSEMSCAFDCSLLETYFA